jgi:cell division protein ZapA
MNRETKKYKVSIFGEHYSLVSDEPEELVAQSARLVDARMQEIAQVTMITDQKKIAVLAAVLVASDLVRLKMEAEHDAFKQKTFADLIEQVLSRAA